MKDDETLDALMADLPELTAQVRDRLRGHDGLFLLETGQGRRLYIRLKDGLATVSETSEEAPVCRVTADERTLMEMLRGRLHPAKALLLRRVTVHGDVRLLMRLIACMD